jgi:hypothetical protein
MNSFQLTTIWVIGAAAGVRCAWLLVWAVHHQWSRPATRRPSGRAYRIDGQFVQVCVSDGSSLADLRALFESIRDDPTLPLNALLLFDGRARREVLAEPDIQRRLAVFLDILRPRMAPAFAVVVSSAIAPSSRAAQCHAEALGVRAELFQDVERARGWLLSV